MSKMKKLVAALLVLTMVLALVGSAMAECKFEIGDCVRFTKNTVAYNHRGGKATSTIVRKGSLAVISRVCDNWVELVLDYTGNTRWFKTDNLKVTTKGKYVPEVGETLYIYVTYAQGGVGKSIELMTFDDADPKEENDINNWRISADCYKHVEAKASVWLHKESSLNKNYGAALHKGDKVTYRRKWGMDSRFVKFYGVRYKGKCLWVSSRYSELVK